MKGQFAKMALVSIASALVAAIDLWVATLIYAGFIFLATNFWFQEEISSDRLAESLTSTRTPQGKITHALAWWQTWAAHLVVGLLLAAISADLHSPTTLLLAGKMVLFGCVGIAGAIIYRLRSF